MGDDSASPTTEAAAKNGTPSERAGTPRATVLRLWSEIRSSSPTLTYEYDPKLVRLLGNDLILTVFDTPPPEYSAPLKIKEIRKVPSGVLVFAQGKGPGQEEVIPVSFLLARAGKRWLVRYDSNLLNRARGQVLAEAQLGLPRTEETQDRAEAAANKAVLDARTLFAKGPRKGTLPPR